MDGRRTVADCIGEGKGTGKNETNRPNVVMWQIRVSHANYAPLSLTIILWISENGWRLLRAKV